jgi:uncharacterized protein involved in outer membrane biogenesis
LALQTTLLGLAIAIIIALVTALVAPLLIDWSAYRSEFEMEASRLVGLKVRVTGGIDARLLPSPQLTLHDIELGQGEDRLRARSLGVEFALGPLMRGQWRASELHVVGPQMRLGLDPSGEVQAPNATVGFDPDALAIERLNIQDGDLTLTDAANGASLTLEKVSFSGEARSLLGPYTGEGSAMIGGRRYPFRISAGRYGNGKLKLRASVNPVDQSVNIEADGMLALGGGKPRFDGSLNLKRPVAIAAHGNGSLSQPWRLSGKVKVTTASALMQDLVLEYGGENSGFKLTGVADFRFGRSPRFDGVLSGLQIDLDRTFGSGGERAAAASVVGKLVQLAGGAFRPLIPIKLGIGIDQVTLGGDSVQNLRGDISTSAQGWNLDRFEFRAPGFTQVRVSGRLTVGDGKAIFKGPAEIKANNPKALAAWLEGRPNATKGDVNPMSLRGQLTLASDRIAIERLNAEFDRKTVTGRFAYDVATVSRPARVEASLQASELDVDAALGFGNALLAGSHIERPHEMSIAVDIGHATIAGLDAREASARLKVDAGGLQVDRLSIADLGGAAISVSGRIVTAPPSPQGSLQLDLDAPDMTPIVTLVSRLAPQRAQSFARSAKVMAPAKLHAALGIAGGGAKNQVKLTINGDLGHARLAFEGGTDVDPITFNPDDVTLQGKLTSDDGQALVTMLGLDHVVSVTPGAGTLVLEAGGPLHGDWRVNGKLSAGGLESKVAGDARPFTDHPFLDLKADIARADAAPLRAVGAGALPVVFAGRIKIAGSDISLSNIDAKIAGAGLHGSLALTMSTPHRLQGTIEVDYLDGAGLVAAAIGMPHQPAGKDAAWNWSSEPFTGSAFGDFAGAVKIKAQHIALLPQLGARSFRATLNLGKDEVSLDDVAAEIAGGQLSGQLSFRVADDGLKAHAKLALVGANAAGLVELEGPPAVRGRLALASELEGFGLSPFALMGSLKGSGKVALTDAQFADLDPRAFAAVTHAVDQGLVINSARIAAIASKALASGRLALKRAEGDFAVDAGQIHMSKFGGDSADARLSVDGRLNLTDGSIAARLVLSGPGAQADAQPDIFITLKGPVTAPQRSIDVSALTAWLTLRAVEKQAKQLRDIESRESQRRPSPPRSEIELAPRNVPTPPIKNNAAAAKSEAVAIPRKAPAVRAKAPPVSNRARAPALPAPIDIHPLPATGAR